MFTAEEAGAVLGRDLWSDGPSQLSGGGPTNVVAHLFASHCQEEIKENLPLPSGPMGWDGGGGRRGGAVAWAGNHKGPKLLSSAVSRVLCPERSHRSELQLGGVGHTEHPLPRHSPDLVPY